MWRSKLNCLVAAFALICVAALAAFPAEFAKRSISALFEAAEAGKISVDELAEGLVAAAERFPTETEEFEAIATSRLDFHSPIQARLLARLDELFKQGRAQDTRALAGLARSVTASGSVELQKALRLCSLVSLRRAIALSASLDELYQAALGSNARGADALAGRLLGDLVARQVERGNWDRQLVLGFFQFALLEEAWGGGCAIEPLTRLLSRATEGHATIPIFENIPAVLSGFLQQAAADHEKVKNAALFVFTTAASKAVAADHPQAARVALEQVLRLRPDPSVSNDELRRLLITEIKGEKSQSLAQELLGELKGAKVLSLSDRFSFSLKGYYGNGLRFFFIGMMLFSLFVMALAALLVYSSTFSPRAKWKRKAEHWPAGGMGVDSRGKLGSERDDEYSRLLAVFGLDDSATEAQIKRAFREGVKQHHPDRHGAQGVVVDEAGNRDDTFQDLRKVYDRIMEIRGSWFGRR